MKKRVGVGVGMNERDQTQTAIYTRFRLFLILFTPPPSSLFMSSLTHARAVEV
jgi:hypothetical protein